MNIRRIIPWGIIAILVVLPFIVHHLRTKNLREIEPDPNRRETLCENHHRNNRTHYQTTIFRRKGLFVESTPIRFSLAWLTLCGSDDPRQLRRPGVVVRFLIQRVQQFLRILTGTCDLVVKFPQMLQSGFFRRVITGVDFNDATQVRQGFIQPQNALVVPNVIPQHAHCITDGFTVTFPFGSLCHGVTFRL